MDSSLETPQARARQCGCVLRNGRLCRAECQADELLQMLALQVATQAGDFCRAAVQFRPDRVVQPVEQIGHCEWCFIWREAEFVVLNPRQGDRIEQASE